MNVSPSVNVQSSRVINQHQKNDLKEEKVWIIARGGCQTTRQGNVLDRNNLFNSISLNHQQKKSCPFQIERENVSFIHPHVVEMSKWE